MTSRVIFHLDMDAFYASIEQRDRPELRGKPVIVGGSPSKRGVVCAASYEARKFGVHSAMPCATAGRLCPKGIFISPRMDHYKSESREIMAILAKSGAEIERMSIDEAFLDLTKVFAEGSSTRSADEMIYESLPLARHLKHQIQSQRTLTASIGVASNKFLAKLASDFQKPDGLTLIPDRDKVAFLRPLPVRAIHGVGKVTESILIKAGLKTIADLQDYPGNLDHLVGSWGVSLQRFAMGIDDRPLDLSTDVKSISSEETFDRDTEDRTVLRGCLKEQAGDISRKLKTKGLWAHTLQIKVRYSDFSTLTRQMTVEDPLQEANTLYRLGCHLLARHQLVKQPLRLLGLGVSGLNESSGRQLLLLPGK